MSDQDTISGPMIVLPEDSEMRPRLGRKLEEYQGRLEGFRAPELQMDTLCKIAVLSRLLETGEVNTFELSIELYEKYGSSFQPADFDNACGVIENYVTTGGANVIGGTGLPPT